MNKDLIELVSMTLQLMTYQEGGEGYKIPPAVLAKFLRTKINEHDETHLKIIDSCDVSDMSHALKELSDSLRMIRAPRVPRSDEVLNEV